MQTQQLHRIAPHYAALPFSSPHSILLHEKHVTCGSESD